jgi:hypothetical protein
MKNLTKFSLIAALLFLTYSCDDLLSVDFDATFSTDMEIDIAETKSDGYAFSDSKKLSIKDDAEVEKHINKIKKLKVTQVDCTLTGIPAGQSITEFNVKVDELNMTVTMNNLVENSTFSLPVTDALLDALSDYLKENHETNITVYGTSSYAPMKLGVKLTFYSNVSAGL